MFYSIKIGEEIKISDLQDNNIVITQMEIKLNSKGENPSKRPTKDVKIIVSGIIKPEVKQQLTSLFNWAKEATKEVLIYRDIEIIARENPDDPPLRTYAFAKAFVVDYSECHKNGSGDEGGTFNLIMAMKDNNLNEAEAY